MTKTMEINNFLKMIGCKNKKHLMMELSLLKEISDYSWYFNSDNGMEVILIDYKNSTYAVRSRCNKYLKREYDKKVRIYKRKFLPLDCTPHNLL